ncbi:MAG: hypothetical protein AB8B92_12060 [Gammaproteobacteria bacterium]
MLLGLAVIFALFSAETHAHGGVLLEQDVCILKIDSYQAHFTIFQPQISKHEQYCEDIPAIGESVFVMEYLDDALRNMQIDFRIIKDTQKLGRFARLEDVEKIKDIQQQTVFYQHPTTNIDGVYLAQYEFTEKGYYIGIVSAKHANQDKAYTAVFPFQAGSKNWGYIPMIIALAIGLLLIYWLMNKGYSHKEIFKS